MLRVRLRYERRLFLQREEGEKNEERLRSCPLYFTLADGVLQAKTIFSVGRRNNPKMQQHHTLRWNAQPQIATANDHTCLVAQPLATKNRAAAGDLKRQVRKALEREVHLTESVIWGYFSQVRLSFFS